MFMPSDYISLFSAFSFVHALMLHLFASLALFDALTLDSLRMGSYGWNEILVASLAQ